METYKLRISEEELIETVLALNPISTIRLTIGVILCKDNAWEEISAVINCPGKDQIVININYELFIMPQLVIKQHWVSGSYRFGSSVRTFA
jgi:hypothetical protein